MAREGRKQLFHKIFWSCLEKCSQGLGWLGRQGGHSKTDLVALPAPSSSTDGAKTPPGSPGWGSPLQVGRISNPAVSTEHSTRQGSFPQAGWFTGKFPASESVKSEWFLNLYSPTHPCLLQVLLSPCSRAEGPAGCGSKALSSLRHC